VDWTDLGEDTIATSDWDVPEGLTAEAPNLVGNTATIWLSGGTEGRVYLVTNRVTTGDNRHDARSFLLTIRKR
jgi:hypothetical protein